MSIKEMGFLSPNMGKWRNGIRSDPKFKRWFDVADDLNRIAMSIQFGHRVPPDCRSCLTLTLCYSRAHQSFQAAIILAEHGMVSDSRAMTRSCIDTVMHMHALAKDPSFVDRMVGAQLGHKKVMAGKLQEADRLRDVNPEAVAKLQKAMDRIKDEQSDGIRWEQIAKKYGLDDLYQLVFRPLSNDGAHCSVDSLNRHVVADANGEIVGLKCGPDTDGLDDAIQSACIAMLWAMKPMVEVYALGEVERRTGEWFQKYTAVAGPGEQAAA